MFCAYYCFACGGMDTAMTAKMIAARISKSTKVMEIGLEVAMKREAIRTRLANAMAAGMGRIARQIATSATVIMSPDKLNCGLWALDAFKATPRIEAVDSQR